MPLVALVAAPQGARAYQETEIDVACAVTLHAPGPPDCTAAASCTFPAPSLPAGAVFLGLYGSVKMKASDLDGSTSPWMPIPCNACDPEPTCVPGCVEDPHGCACRTTYDKTEFSVCAEASTEPCASVPGTNCSYRCEIAPFPPGSPCDLLGCDAGGFVEKTITQVGGTYVPGSTMRLWIRTWDACLTVSEVKLRVRYAPPVDLYVTTGSPTGTDVTRTLVPGGCDPFLSEPCPPIDDQLFLVAKLAPGIPPAGKTATFTLDTSQYPGLANNVKRIDVPLDASDFYIGSPAAIPTASHMVIADVPFNGSGIASLPLHRTDWGGWSLANVMVPQLIGVLNTCTTSFPYDPDGNHLPNAGWVRLTSDGAGTTHEPDPATVPGSTETPDTDEDTIVRGTSAQQKGDGLTFREEYRGFFVDFAHVRTNPRVKDVFVALVNYPAPWSETAKESLRQSTVSVHFPWHDCDPNTSEILYPAAPIGCNATFTRVPGDITQRPGGVAQQRALTLYVDSRWPLPADVDTTWLGVTWQAGAPCGPWCTSGSSVYQRHIMRATPPTFDPLVYDETINTVDSRTHAKVTTHEIGHGMSLEHYDWGVREQCPGNDPKTCMCKGRNALPNGSCTPAHDVFPSSTMCTKLACWALDTCKRCNKNNCVLENPSQLWANLPVAPAHQVYDNIDATNIRLHP